MADVIDITDCPRLDLNEALAAPAGDARTVLFPGGDEIAPRPMLWPCALSGIEAAHQEALPVADVQLHVAGEVVVGGSGAHVRRGDAYLHADGANPGYIRHWMQADLDGQYWTFEPAAPTARLPAAYALLHFNLVYGHWLTEMFPKLFVIAHLAGLGVRAPILLPDTAPAYIRATVEEVLPGQEIVTYHPPDEQVAVDRLLLPGMMHGRYDFHPALNDQLAAYVAPRLTRGPAAIFVSRTALADQSAFRRLENTAAVEKAAADLGLAVVHPEQLSWREQVGLFGGARLIVGEYGSGLHGALFAPEGARVVGLNWITDVQSRIANFRRQDVGYILDPDGEPRTYSLQPRMRGFQIDPTELRRRLEPLVEAPPPRRWWLQAMLGR